MVQRLLDGDVLEIFLRGVQERPAAGSEPDFADLVDLSAAHALMHRVVLAVDWKKRFVVLASFGSDQLSSCDQAFFVRKSDALAGFDSFVGGFETGNSDDRADDEINFRMSRDF